MGLAGADGEGCTGAVAGPCASNATGTTDKVASKIESLLVTSNAPLKWDHSVPRPTESLRSEIRSGSTYIRAKEFSKIYQAARNAAISVADTGGRIKSTVEHYPSGSVVARVFLSANPSVYTPLYESVARCWREKEMIQPHSLV